MFGGIGGPRWTASWGTLLTALVQLFRAAPTVIGKPALFLSYTGKANRDQRPFVMQRSNVFADSEHQGWPQYQLALLALVRGA